MLAGKCRVNTIGKQDRRVGRTGFSATGGSACGWEPVASTARLQRCSTACPQSLRDSVAGGRAGV